MSLEPAPKIQDSQVHQCYNIATLDTKNGRAQYDKSQQNRKDEKGKKG